MILFQVNAHDDSIPNDLEQIYMQQRTLETKTFHTQSTWKRYNVFLQLIPSTDIDSTSDKTTECSICKPISIQHNGSQVYTNMSCFHITYFTQPGYKKTAIFHLMFHTINTNMPLTPSNYAVL